MIRRIVIAWCLVLSISASAPHPGARAEQSDSEQIVLALSRPGEPGILILQHYKGSVTVTGYDGLVVVIRAALPREGATGEAGGMRSIAAQALDLHAFEKENVVTVTTNSHERTIDLDIRVPADFSLQIEKRDAGAVTAYHLRGEMDISSSVSDIQLLDIAGTAVLNAVDGSITVSFSEVTPLVPMSFTSVTGNITVSFPPDLSAILKMRSDHGGIASDFDIDLERRHAEIDTSRVSGVRRASLDRWTYGSVGAGGSQYVFQSYRGSIEIQKSRDLSKAAK